MIPAKMGSFTITTLQEKGIDSVFDWFEQHQQSFYALGWFYLRNQKQMEELFYQAIIKVHKELPRYKHNASFGLWVTSIFIDHCRELSQDKVLPVSEEIEPHQNLFEALDQLEDDEKEAMVLTYGTGFSQEEAAHFLRVSEAKMKELLFSGIQSLRKQLYGSIYNGCKEYQRNYIDYLEKSMNRPEKIEFELHIYECQECQEDLATFQDVTLMLNHAEWMNDLPVPDHFMETIKERLTEKENHRQQKNKKRKKVALVFVSVFAFLFGIGFFTGAFANVYYAWSEEDEQLRTFLQNDLGQRMNLVAESEGVKITITGVVADDFQTLVFYEIEDTNQDNQYLMNYEDGLYVEDENEIMNQETYPRFYPPDLEADMNKQKNIFYGKVGLRPIKEDTEIMKLKISKLMGLNPNSVESMGLGFMPGEYKEGAWSFEVPVTKQPSTEYALDKETEIEGVPVRIEKLTVAPTATVLHYGIHTGKPERRIDYVSISELEVNNKKVKTDRFGGSYPDSLYDIDWQTFQTHFDPIYGEEPKEVKVKFETAQFSIQDNKSIELDVNAEYPQTFEYAGSTISIDKLEVGQPTTIVLSDHNIKNREYESFNLNVVGENEQEVHSISMYGKGVLVDKYGVEYDPMSGSVDYEKLEQPRHFITEQTIRLEGNKVIPKRLEIFGYNSMKYLDDVVKITVK